MSDSNFVPGSLDTLVPGGDPALSAPGSLDALVLRKTTSLCCFCLLRLLLWLLLMVGVAVGVLGILAVSSGQSFM